MVRKYRVRISGYYAAGSPYNPPPEDRADKVDRICCILRRLGYQVTREECK